MRPGSVVAGAPTRASDASFSWWQVFVETQLERVTAFLKVSLKFERGDVSGFGLGAMAYRRRNKTAILRVA